MIKGIAHVAYEVVDMEKTLAFYCEKLGLKKVFSIPDENGNPWIEYVKVAEGQFIEFFYAKGPSSGNSSYKHLCLEVDDIHAIAAQMQAAGVPLRVAPQQGKDQNWQCWVNDPDGNPIEFMQIDPASPQAKS